MSRNSVIRIAGDIANPPSNVSPAIEIVQNDPNNAITGRFLFKFHLISKSSKLCRGLPELNEKLKPFSDMLRRAILIIINSNSIINYYFNT